MQDTGTDATHFIHRRSEDPKIAGRPADLPTLGLSEILPAPRSLSQVILYLRHRTGLKKHWRVSEREFYRLRNMGL
jgi:hypothetical protein